MNTINKVLSTDQTIVNFFGIAVYLPEGYDTITMDSNGAVFIHPTDSVVEPVYDAHGFGEWDSCGIEEYDVEYDDLLSQYVCHVEYVGNWYEFVMTVDI